MSNIMDRRSLDVTESDTDLRVAFHVASAAGKGYPVGAEDGSDRRELESELDAECLRRACGDFDVSVYRRKDGSLTLVSDSGWAVDFTPAQS